MVSNTALMGSPSALAFAIQIEIDLGHVGSVGAGHAGELGTLLGRLEEALHPTEKDWALPVLRFCR